jgi:TatD DNase family protein
LSDDQLEDQVEHWLAQAAAVDVTAVLSVGTTINSSRACLALAERFSSVRAAVGIHPNYCCQAGAEDWATIIELSKHPRVAALGETGLDRYWDDCPWEVQVDYFQRHLQLSRETELPLVIHTRDCAEETVDILREETKRGPIRGVMHSFTGPQVVADECLRLGLYISFAGMVTYKNADDLRAIAKTIPADRLLVETDSPYLTPHPFRGKKPNHPANVAHTLRCIAEVRGESYGALAAQTTLNAQRLFGAW